METETLSVGKIANVLLQENDSFSGRLNALPVELPEELRTRLVTRETMSTTWEEIDKICLNLQRQLEAAIPIDSRPNYAAFLGVVSGIVEGEASTPAILMLAKKFHFMKSLRRKIARC